MMPSSSRKQHNFMEAVANSPKFAKKAGVPQSVGKEFAAADKGMKFKRGGKAKRYVEGGTIEMLTGEKQNGPEYSADDIKEGLKKLGRFFGFRRPDSEPSAPIETRTGSPRPGAEKAEVVKPEPVKPEPVKPTIAQYSNRPEKVETSTSTAGPKPPPPPSVQEEMARREKGGDNSGDDYGNGKGSSSFTTTALKPAAPFKPNAPKPAVSATSRPTAYQGDARKAEPKEVAAPPKPAPKPKTRDQVIAENTRAIEEKILSKKPTAMTAQMRNAPTNKQLYEGQESFSDFIMSPFKALRESNEARRKEEEKRRKDIRDRARAKEEEGNMAKGGMISRGRSPIQRQAKEKTQTFAQGGFVRKSADGCAQRGKTRGQIR